MLHCPIPCCRPRQSKPEIRLTPGKGLQDLTCSLEELIDQVVKSCKVGVGPPRVREHGRLSNMGRRVRGGAARLGAAQRRAEHSGALWG